MSILPLLGYKKLIFDNNKKMVNQIAIDYLNY